MAVLKDIAMATGVSVGTVSRILNQGRAHLYSSDTRQRVVEASQRLKYRPNRSAQAMRLQKTRIVGFADLALDSDGVLQNHTVFPFVTGLSRRLAKANYHVTLTDCTEMGDPEQPDEPWFVQERFLDAIVVHYGLVDRAERFAKNVGVPLIWWDSGVFSPHNSVYRDEAAVARKLTRKLIELGHQRIGYATNIQIWEEYKSERTGKFHYSYSHRMDSYREEMRSHGLREYPIIRVPNDIAQVAQQLKEQQITAVIGGAQEPAIFAAASMLGWRIPEDISVATVDREARIVTHSPHIGGMLYDRFSLGEQTADMLLTILEGDEVEVPSIRYVGELDLGDTIAPPRKKK